MIRLWLVRHGQTKWNVEGRWQGSTDLDLNEYGVEQARILASSLNGRKFSALFSSTLIRAKATADILNEILQCKRFEDPRLNEIKLGAWEGKLGSDIPGLDPDAWNRWNAGDLAASAPNGESRIELANRTKAAADSIVKQFPEGEILVVSHKVTIESLICLAKAEPLETIGTRPVPNLQPIEILWPPQ